MFGRGVRCRRRNPGVAVIVLLLGFFGCSSTVGTEYTRSSTPLGVTDGDVPEQIQDDTGSDTGE